MARPIKHNADYFSHDADMRNDQKINAVRNRFGLEGYAVWNMILEVLTDKDYFEYPWNELEIELLASDFRITPDKLTEIVNYCQKIGLLSIDSGLLFSENHKKRFRGLIDKRDSERKRKPNEIIINDGNPVIDDGNPVIDDGNTQSKVKESKQEDIKENNINEDIPSVVHVSKNPIDNERIDDEAERLSPEKPVKIKFAEFVHMTQSEYDKLQQEYGTDGADRMIQILDNYKGSKGKQYKNDCRAILSWVVDRYTEEKNKPNCNKIGQVSDNLKYFQ